MMAMYVIDTACLSSMCALPLARIIVPAERFAPWPVVVDDELSCPMLRMHMHGKLPRQL